ncbi:MAG: tRNA (adenosine(37)-N6)-threonylcarbamoyltransferase complex ATPase subunit type 1 TsaE [Patescibacteria group bacterium]
MLKISSDSAKKTKETAQFLAEKVFKKPSGDSALVIALSGDLGAGKTTFIQGFLKMAGVKKRITSPTFVIFKRFKINDLKFKNIYHVDCYRLNKPAEILKLGFKEIINNPQNIILIEWAEKIKNILPKKIIRIKFDYGKKENERKIEVISHL